jgi:hypothetical protein
MIRDIIVPCIVCRRESATVASKMCTICLKAAIKEKLTDAILRGNF